MKKKLMALVLSVILLVIVSFILGNRSFSFSSGWQVWSSSKFTNTICNPLPPSPPFGWPAAYYKTIHTDDLYCNTTSLVNLYGFVLDSGIFLTLGFVISKLVPKK